MKTAAPEIRTRVLFTDRYVGLCRIGHPLLAAGEIDMQRWLAYDHVTISRTGEADNPIDARLESTGVPRNVPIVVPSYTGAMQLVRHSDLLAVVPHSCLGNAFMPDYAAENGVQSFALPLPLPAFNISAIWHPRLDHDPAHRWLRDEVRAVCAAAYPDSTPAAPSRADR